MAFESLYDKVGYDTTVEGVHFGTIGVENSDDTDVDIVLTVVVKEEGFANAFSFVVTTTNSDRIYIPPVFFFLRMCQRVTINFGGGGLKDTCTSTFGQAEHVHAAKYRGLHGLDRVLLVVRGGCRTSHVIDAVAFKHDRFGNVMTNQFEVWIV